MAEVARTLCCPVCGRELGIAPHVRGKPWTSSQVWLVRKLKRWMTNKAIGAYFGVGHLAIEMLLKDRGGRKRLGIPALTTSIRKASGPEPAGRPAVTQGGGGMIEPQTPTPAAADTRQPTAAGVLLQEPVRQT